MPDSEQVIEAYRDHVNRSFALLAKVAGSTMEVSASGAVMRDEKGQDYLQCGGFGVLTLGHSHPKVVEAVERQLRRLPMTGRLLLSPELAAAAEALCAKSPPGLEYAFFLGSGTEATELALKLARANGHRRVVSMEGGFHGKTMGALSVTGRELYRAPFEPLLGGVSFVPFGDADAVAAALAESDEPAAVILEPVQGEGGVQIPPKGYLTDVRRACTEAGALLIVDEIQTGLGRLGAWWGCGREGVEPDMMLAGKALGGGVLPASAVVATEAAFEPLNQDVSIHSSTFAGAPLAMAAVTATLEVVEEEQIVERAGRLGARLLDLVQDAVDDTFPHLVTDVRGEGLMLGIEMPSSSVAAELSFELQRRHVLVSASFNAREVIRLTPPAILEDEHVEWLDRALREAGRALTAIHPEPVGSTV